MRRPTRFLAASLVGAGVLAALPVLAEDPPGLGDLVITEIMQNPAMVFDAAGEWFEVYNSSSTTIDLAGVTVRDLGTDSFVIGTTTLVAPGSYAVIARNGDTGLNGGVTAVYGWGAGMDLANDADELEIVAPGGTVVDTVIWDGGPGFPDPNGASMSLDLMGLGDLLNDDGMYWCAATSAYGLGDLGTPGTENDLCMALWDVDGDGYTVDVDCDDSDPAIHPGATEVCDGVDNDCDAIVDPGCGEACDVTLIGPAEGSDLTTQARFMWQGDCEGYAIQISRDASFPDFATYWFGSLGDGPSGQNYTVGTTIWGSLVRQFVDGGYWRIVGGIDGAVALGETRSFYTTEGIAPTPVTPVTTCSVAAVAPADGASVTSSPLFDWSDGCSGYRLELSTDPTFPVESTYYFGSTSRSDYRLGDSLWGTLAPRFLSGGYWRAVGGAADGAHASTPRAFTYVEAAAILGF